MKHKSLLAVVVVQFFGITYYAWQLGETRKQLKRSMASTAEATLLAASWKDEAMLSRKIMQETYERLLNINK